jgi:hypothetical protein
LRTNGIMLTKHVVSHDCERTLNQHGRNVFPSLAKIQQNLLLFLTKHAVTLPNHDTIFVTLLQKYWSYSCHKVFIHNLCIKPNKNTRCHTKPNHDTMWKPKDDKALFFFLVAHCFPFQLLVKSLLLHPNKHKLYDCFTNPNHDTT